MPDEDPDGEQSAAPASASGRTVSDGGSNRPPLFDRPADEIAAAIPDDIPATPMTVPPESASQPDFGEADATGVEGDTGFDGAPDDEEMPLAEHVEEMATRLFIVLTVMAGVATLTLPASDELINFLWYSFLDGPAEECGQVAVEAAQGASAAGPEGADCPHIYSPLGLILARLKVASLVGFVVALPVFVYETYLFMRPGLYPRERRYYLAAVPTSLVLAGAGVSFAYFLVLRAMFEYFITYSDRAADLAFGLGDTFNLIILMLGFFALIFQIPLFVMLAIMMGVTTRRWLVQRRLYFWGAFGAIAFVFSPDPTGMAPLLVALTMIGLFEATLVLLRWTGSGEGGMTAEDLAARRPAAYLVAGLVGYLLSTAPIPTGYYGQLPTLLTETLGASTPMLLGGGLIAVFELSHYLNKRTLQSARLWRALKRARLPVWGVAIVVGYLGSPDPTLFRLVAQVALPTAIAAGLGLGLVICFEAVLFVMRRREDEA